MKTMQILSMATDAITTLTQNANMVDRFIRQNPEDLKARFKEATGQNVHLFLSYPCSVVRDLIRELPEALVSPELEKLSLDLFPHLFEEKNYEGFYLHCSEVHTILHKMNADAFTAKELYGF